MKSTCPSCHHTFQSTEPKIRVRNCAVCNQNIGRHDKWFFNKDGKIQHRHCDYPESYVHPTMQDHSNNKIY